MIPMEPDVQRSVDIVWTMNSVIISKELVTTGVRLAITHHAVRKVYQRENKQTHTYVHFYLNASTWLKVKYFFLSMHIVVCKKGTFGKNCATICGHCKDEVACDKETGACPSGCQRWYEGIYCNQCRILLALV